MAQASAKLVSRITPAWSFAASMASLFAVSASTYVLREHHIYNLEEHEARMDELEGTLRGHIGLIEDALDRLEGKANENKKDALYSTRARYEKKEGK